MSQELRRSFAVTFMDPDSPAVVEWLGRLDELIAELGELPLAARCTFEETSRTLVPGGVVGYDTVLRFFKQRDENANRVATSVMQALFDLRERAPDIQVRFYCRWYGHQHGACECSDALSRYNKSRFGPPVYCPLADGSRRDWLMDRADLLALTDDQLEAVEVRPTRKQHLINFIEWFRQHPDAP